MRWNEESIGASRNCFIQKREQENGRDLKPPAFDFDFGGQRRNVPLTLKRRKFKTTRPSF